MGTVRRLFRSRNPFDPSPAAMGASYVVLAFWTFVVLFPLYWLLVTAFKSPSDVDNGPKFIPFVDFQPTAYAWGEMISQPIMGSYVLHSYLNTIVVGTISSLAALALGSSAAYALSRFRYQPKLGLIGVFVGCVFLAVGLMAVGLWWVLSVAVGIAVFVLLAQGIGRRFRRALGNDDISFWLISQRMLPPIVTIIPIYILFQSLHMLDTQAALIISYCAAFLPLAVWFMRDYFHNIPIELEESAFIDGATRYQVLQRIILPLSAPGLVATYLIILVFAWNEYTLALFLSSANAQTMPLVVQAQNATRGPQWWNISLLVLLMIAPIIFAAIILERFIARGLLIGAVKS